MCYTQKKNSNRRRIALKEKLYDVAIIGAGASGLCTSVSLKMQDRSLSVVLLEQLDRVGKKLITTGNGRCNITNANIELDRYHGKNKEFARFALERFDRVYTESFLAELGIVFTFDDEGRAYPYSLQASSVVDAFRFAADNLGVETRLQEKVEDIEKTKQGYEIKTQNGKIASLNVVCATGLYSGGGKIGSNGSLFRVLKQKGYKTVAVTPAIVQIKTENSLTKSLKGIKVNANATILSGGKAIRSEFGEVLFCDYGLSGPPILQISRCVERTNDKKQIVLDLMPEYTYESVLEMLKYRLYALRGRTLEEFFTGMLNKRLGQAIIKLINKKLSDSVDSLAEDDLKALTSLIKGLNLEVAGTTGFDNSQVSAGGLDTCQFDSKTMMSKKDKGLYAIGEILDIDGDCGGFNLQWAWSSALCAAESIIDDLR